MQHIAYSDLALLYYESGNTVATNPEYSYCHVSTFFMSPIIRSLCEISPLFIAKKGKHLRIKKSIDIL